MEGLVGRLEEDSKSHLEEDSKNKKTQKKSNEQKKREINAICVNIIKHRLGSFCKTNATALALIFKALIRGEAVYSRVQFLQDSSANALLCQKENQKNNQKSLQQTKNFKDFKESPEHLLNQEESKSNKKNAMSKLDSKQKEITRGIGEEEIEKKMQKNHQLQDFESQEMNTKNPKKDSDEPIQQTSKDSKEARDLPSFPLNIEG